MGMTMTQKILSPSRRIDTVKQGNDFLAKLDIVMANDIIY